MIAVMLPARAEDRDTVASLAEDFSPRIECGASGVALDASGISRLFGSAAGLAQELARQAASRGLAVRVAIAATRTAAALAARASLEGWSVGNFPTLQPSNHTIVLPSGREAAALAPLPLDALAHIDDLIGPALAKAGAAAPKPRRKGQGRHYRLAPAPPVQQLTQSPAHEITKSLARLERWGLATLGDLASLPAPDLSARLGAAGLVLQRAARGEDERPLVPATPPPSFLQSFRLEWPVDDLQPLAFIVARLCESLEQALAAADRGAISLTTMLRLVTKEAYARTLALPAPMRDARVLRTLVMLDLESHPPGAAIDEVVIDVDVAPGRILQTGLFEPALPAPETLSTLVARLGAVIGESRVGAPAVVDTHEPGAFAITPFAPHQAQSAIGSRLSARAAGDNAPAAFASGREPNAESRSEFVPPVIRRFRPPRAARVRVGARGPVRVEADDITGDVVTAAGPWRSAGGWWNARGTTGSSGGWDRDEWDVALETGLACRLAQDRATGKWMVDGVLD
jgi:protein ImuB